MPTISSNRDSFTRRRLSHVAGCIGLVLAGCGSDEQPAQLPNPAAVYCEQRGGTVSGPEPMCQLPDGTTVDAWGYHRANAPE